MQAEDVFEEVGRQLSSSSWQCESKGVQALAVVAVDPQSSDETLMRAQTGQAATKSLISQGNGGHQ